MQSEYRPLVRVLLKHAREAFASQLDIDGQWRGLSYRDRPILATAVEEYDRFVRLLHAAGVDCVFLPADRRTGLDSIYVRDAAVAWNGGLILGRMGKPQRATEPAALAEACRALGIPVHGSIAGEGRLEGGDVVWLGDRTIAVGQGARTNARGIRQLQAMLGNGIDECMVVALPDWHGPGDVLHLMSLVSPIDRDLALVYPPLLPAPFMEQLTARGIRLIAVFEAEFESMGGNVLAIAPRVCIMLRGNPRVRTMLESAGAQVAEYDGAEICRKGSGGPTCLTQPLRRV